MASKANPQYQGQVQGPRQTTGGKAKIKTQAMLPSKSKRKK